MMMLMLIVLVVVVVIEETDGHRHETMTLKVIADVNHLSLCTPPIHIIAVIHDGYLENNRLIKGRSNSKKKKKKK